MLGMFFSRFLHISTHISLGFLSRGSAEADIGWGENWTTIYWQLCQKYLHQKLWESNNLCSS